MIPGCCCACHTELPIHVDGEIEHREPVAAPELEAPDSVDTDSALGLARSIVRFATGDGGSRAGTLRIARALIAAHDRIAALTTLRLDVGDFATLSRFAASAHALEHHPLTAGVVAKLLAAQEFVK